MFRECIYENAGILQTASIPEQTKPLQKYEFGRRDSQNSLNSKHSEDFQVRASPLLYIEQEAVNINHLTGQLMCVCTCLRYSTKLSIGGTLQTFLYKLAVRYMFVNRQDCINILYKLAVRYIFTKRRYSTNIPIRTS